MKNAIDFVRFALSHAKRETIPAGAQIPLDIEECGTSPWEYLFGTTGNIVTQDLLNRRFSEYYSKRGWTRERFDRATENWAARRVTVCDCQGLLDVFVGVDVNAHYCYAAWCTEKGEISGIGRPYVLGEAVFIQGSSERMTHVGYVCGFLNGEPLIVEARGLNFGVCVTKFSDMSLQVRDTVEGETPAAAATSLMVTAIVCSSCICKKSGYAKSFLFVSPSLAIICSITRISAVMSTTSDSNSASSCRWKATMTLSSRSSIFCMPSVMFSVLTFWFWSVTYCSISLIVVGR